MRTATLLLLFATACSTPGRFVPYASVHALDAPQRLIALDDYGRNGLAAVQRYLAHYDAEHGTDLAHDLGRWRRACVRVRAYTPDGAVVIGSGVRIDGGRRVLTAHHVLTQAPVDTIEIVQVDGTIEPATVDAPRPGSPTAAEDDWILLRIGDAVAHPPPLKLAKPVTGELAVLLGYPDHLGIDTDGSVAHGLTLADDAPLEPLPLVVRILSTRPLRLVPIAGALPLGGASGGPVFDRRGRLLGVLSRLQERTATDGCSFLLLAAAPRVHQ